MSRFGYLFFLLLFPALLAVSCQPALSRQPSLVYADMGGHWASDAVAQCNYYGLMYGYPGNLFKPDNELTRAEALAVIVRSLGWDLVAGEAPGAGISFPPDLWRGFRGPVAAAAEKGVIPREVIPAFRFNEPAARLEVAVWLARALNLSGSGTTLNFRDLYQVRLPDLDLVAGVVQAGIMTGLPGNNFGPSRPLTRAEMASILVRMLDSGRGSPAVGRHLAGKLILKDPANNKISIQTNEGTGSYVLAEGCSVSRLGQKGSLDLINLGENVRVSLNQAGKAILIIYLTGTLPGPAGLPEGTRAGGQGNVANKFRDYFTVLLGDGTIQEISLSAVSFYKNGKGADYSELKKGSRVELLKSGPEVKAVSILEGDRKVAGQIDQVGSGSIYIKDSDGRTNIFELKPGALIKDITGQQRALDYLEPGMQVDLTLDAGDGVTTVLVREGSGQLEGVVEDISLDGTRWISIRDMSGDSRTYYLKDTGLIVAESGLARNPEYIMRGMYVKLSRDSYGSYISRIEITGWSMVEGRVNYIQTSGSRRIEIIKSGGGAESYYLTDAVTVREGGDVRSLEYASTGRKNVRLVLNSYRNVVRIFITDWLALEGTVTLIEPMANGRIEIRRPGGGIEAYYLAEGVTVSEGDISRSLGSVTTGSAVRLTLGGNNRITRIVITGSSDVEGKVVYVQMAGRRRIEIRKNSGVQEIYYLADNVSVMEGGTARSLNYLVGGANVRLFLNNNGEAVQIMVSGPSSVEGRVTYVSTSGTRSIQIEKSNGALDTYSIANGVTVREGGTTLYLSYIKEGMNVRLELDSSGAVYQIEYTGTQIVEGRVRSIQTLGTKWIEVEKASGQVAFYDLAEGVWVRQGGITLNLTGIVRDMRVRLTLDSNWRVSRIDVI